MGLDLTSFNSALKEWYTPRRVQNMVYQDNPFLALVPKSTKFPGRNMPVPVIYGNPTTTSAIFGTAQTAASSYTTKVTQFTMTRVKRYGVAVVDGEALKATESDEGAFLKALKTEIDGVIHQLKRNLAVQLYRSGWGDIGQVGSASGTSITLKNTEDVTNFEVGQVLQFASSATDAGYNALRGGGGTLAVTGVNRTTGVITVSATYSTITSLTNDDYIYLSGDRQDAGSGTAVRRCVAGLEAWAPSYATGVSSTSFFGVDRSTDPTRLAGQRINGAGSPIEEVLIDGAVQAGREGFKVDKAFMSYAKWASLEKALMGKVVYNDVPATANIAFKAITINGPRGPIQCIADQNCPGNRIFMTNFDHLKLHSLGELVRTIDDDGNMLLRQQSSDGVESRHGFYGNLACDAPASIVNITV